MGRAVMTKMGRMVMKAQNISAFQCSEMREYEKIHLESQKCFWSQHALTKCFNETAFSTENSSVENISNSFNLELGKFTSFNAGSLLYTV